MQISKSVPVIIAICKSFVVLFVSALFVVMSLAMYSSIVSQGYEPDGKGRTSLDKVEGRTATCDGKFGYGACKPSEASFYSFLNIVVLFLGVILVLTNTLFAIPLAAMTGEFPAVYKIIYLYLLVMSLVFYISERYLGKMPEKKRKQLNILLYSFVFLFTCSCIYFGLSTGLVFGFD